MMLNPIQFLEKLYSRELSAESKEDLRDSKLSKELSLQSIRERLIINFGQEINYNFSVLESLLTELDTNRLKGDYYKLGRFFYHKEEGVVIVVPYEVGFKDSLVIMDYSKGRLLVKSHIDYIMMNYNRAEIEEYSKSFKRIDYKRKIGSWMTKECERFTKKYCALMEYIRKELMIMNLEQLYVGIYRCKLEEMREEKRIEIEISSMRKIQSAHTSLEQERRGFLNPEEEKNPLFQEMMKSLKELDKKTLKGYKLIEKIYYDSKARIIIIVSKDQMIKRGYAILDYYRGRVTLKAGLLGASFSYSINKLAENYKAKKYQKRKDFIICRERLREYTCQKYAAIYQELSQYVFN